MATDDRILLNLVLNEATVSAVEGRVRNLVNRLNNTNISLNINGRNLDNIVNRLNDIQQRMQTINSTPVNINAGLTQAQQQYRLETERLRVSQQIELSRQRTLQTENQAVSALAQQNRTLNINNNVTHQIGQDTQNIGNNMNVAGGHARDFIDYLADGVRYIVVYRSLYEIMNQIGEAFSEMKDVNKELISVRKTTGMSENEIEKIRQSSYGVATEYGRTASEYLGSVSEFARAGYKGLSTELAKVSLLTQNVGDVSSESSNKMLLAVNAAFGLNGSLSELTNVVNGLNNVANLNPTSMQKLADGMQVSASVAKVTGLEIADLVALIGTGTAVTQREGSEISRAVRTILMNIRQVKGELDDGTVIDGDSIAKAEKALNGVGIATKEMRDGIRQLRNPMSILDELAGKWSTLNTEAQSIVLESLANKRQANVLAAILENYEMVGKMQNEYFDSANSAIKENELFLQGWEATQNRLSSKWTEFIANMADTALIIGTLNTLHDILVALDSPIGRIATQIILINTALALTGRLWQAIRARSIVADILSMGVAERNFGVALQLVTGHLWQQVRAWAATPFGMTTLAVSSIMLISSAINKYKESLRESAEEASKQAEESANHVDSLLNLKSQLNEGTKSTDELTSAFEEQLKAMGWTESEIDTLITKYGGLAGAIDEATRKALENARTTAHTDVATSSKSLETEYDGNSDIIGQDSTIEGLGRGMNGSGNAKLDKQIREILNDKGFMYDPGNIRYRAKDDSAASIYEYYQGLQEIIQLMQQTASETNNSAILETYLYNDVRDAVDQLSESANLYGDAISRLHNADAQLELADYLKTNSIDSKETFDNYINGIKNSTEYSDEYKLVLIDIANKTFPQFSGAAKDVKDSVNDFSAETSNALSKISGASDSISTLSKAFKELSDDGYITLDSISEIKEAVGDSIDNWDEYEQKLLTAKVGSAEFNQTMGELTYAILEQELGLDKLANADEAYIARLLKENGVLNANETAHEVVARAKYNQYLQTIDLNNVTATQVQELINLATQCGATAQQIDFLTDAMSILANTDLNLADKSAQLLQMAASAGIAMVAIGEASSMLAGMQSGNIGDLRRQEYSGKSMTDLYKSSIQEIIAYFGGLGSQISGITPKYSGSKSKSGSDEPEVFDKTEAIIRRINLRHEQLAEERELLETQADLAGEEEDYRKQAELTNDVIAKETERIKELTNANIELSKEAQKVRDANSKYNTESWFNANGEETEAYIDLLNSVSKEEQENIQEIFEQLQKFKQAWFDNADAIIEANEKIAEDERELTKIHRNEFDQRLELSETYISQQETLGWQNGDSEVKARQRILEWIQSDYYRSLIESEEEYQDILIENLGNYKDAVENELSSALTAVENERDRIAESLEKENEKIDEQISKEEGLLSIRSKEFEIINKISDAQHEADKAIANSRISKEYLSDSEYAKIFNEEDYEEMTDRYEALGEDVADITERFNKQIADAYANDQTYLIESITAEYERQMGMKERELEIVQAEYDLKKKELALDNVLAEKNVRKFVERDGKIYTEWVADADKVRQATEELSEAQYNISRLSDENAQQLELDYRQLTIDNLNNIRNANEDQIEALDEAVDKIAKEIERLTEPTVSLYNAMSIFEAVGVTSLSNAVNDTVSVLSKLTNKKYNKIVSPNGKTVTVGSDGWAEKGLSAGTTVKTAGGDYIITSVNPDGTYQSQKLTPVRNLGYASGTFSAAKGIRQVNEKGEETYITPDGLLHNFSGGEPVFNTLQTENLWKLSKGIMPDVLANAPKINRGVGNSKVMQFYGDINVNKPVDFNDFVRKLTNTINQKSGNM